MKVAKRLSLLLLVFFLILSCTGIVHAAELPTTRSVSDSSEQKAAIQYCYKNGLMEGSNLSNFNPKDNITREALAEALYQMAGAPSVTPQAFSDVPTGNAHLNAISWVCEKGILEATTCIPTSRTQRISDRTSCFYPDKTLTKGEVIQALFQYALTLHHTLSAAESVIICDGIIETETTVQDIYNWATSIELTPLPESTNAYRSETATREYCALLLYRYVKWRQPSSSLSIAGTTNTITLPPTIADISPVYNLGTCKKLSGEIQVVLLFMDDNTSRWNQAAIEKITANAIIPGFKYLQEKAKLNNVSLSFTYRSFSNTDRDMTYPGNIDLKNSPDMTKIASILGYSSANNMHTAMMCGRTDVVYLVLVNKPGRCYARVDSSKNNDDIVEFGTIFSSRAENGKDAYAASIAHETLHLFGALDLYNDKGSPRQDMVSELYPKEIMLVTNRNINELIVSPITSYLLAWQTRRIPPILLDEDFWG